MRREAQVHAKGNADKCGGKRRYIKAEVQVHADRRTGTCGEKRRYVWREAQEHEEESTRAPCYASICKSKIAVGNCRPSILFHESQGYLKEFKISDQSKA